MQQQDVLLRDFRVVDFSTGIAGSYCTKMLVDAGADVVKVETGADGDPLRCWRQSGDTGPGDGALFQYLAAGKRSIRGSLRDSRVREFVAGADLVVESGELTTDDIEFVRRTTPGVDILSVTPFGRTGPWAHLPATDFTLQALAGSMAIRGPEGREPLQAGGRLGEWIAGSFAAATALGLRVGAAGRGRGGEWADLSMLESMGVAMALYHPVTAVLSGAPGRRTPRTVEIPSIEHGLDGYVGFCTITAQMFEDFLIMIDRADLLADDSIVDVRRRQERYAEFKSTIESWTTSMPVEAIDEIASAMRIPVAPIGTPETVTQNMHFAERGVFVENPAGFVQPRRPYLVDGALPDPVRAAPSLGEHDSDRPWNPRTQPSRTLDETDDAPLAGVRVLDLTAFWAGPAATQLLAGMGAEVIKVESVQRPDGMRFTSTRSPGEPDWWEAGGVYQGANAGKLGVTLDLSRPEGVDVLLEMIRNSDIVIENFSPRVLDNFGLTWERIHEANPAAVFVRMPAFGLSGPWRDRTGFAQTMEQATGLSWMTGYRDGSPMVLKGPCDPVAGLHAVVATLSALELARSRGRGCFVEVPMVESALNVAAEMVIEHSAYGNALSRDGNRGPIGAPQGVYRCAGEENWLAVAVTDDARWEAACDVLGFPDSVLEPEFASANGRRRHHDRLDELLTEFCAARDVDELEGALTSRGIAAARVVDPSRILDNPQVRARGFPEKLDHPVLGTFEIPGLPVVFASHSGPAFTVPAPLLGQHNAEVLTALAGVDPERLVQLSDADVIGHRPLHL
ncbi:crotonobetainyl-CoA:carnitine CoA-transferase CaiB-like acyl-CoA transferase [Rhodococcus sp. OK519]|uniref:CaiB/BaiF CoA-transferase family protein n=1 Tax=Rhodococcus sp. OK519 TaxID=2135729 RepID=UPI000D44D4EF|nr:crotonobetainyl-CoA:carnitine CoA-transferase CaiB-like acyl-CoA transferase [Rhodococcus sp. OK519]